MRFDSINQRVYGNDEFQSGSEVFSYYAGSGMRFVRRERSGGEVGNAQPLSTMSTGSGHASEV
jgi:hypothetical protein